MIQTYEEQGYDPARTDELLDRGQRPGDILLFCRPTGFSRIISWLTRSPYYHVAICEDIWHVIEARPRGVVRRDLRTREGGCFFKVIPAPHDVGYRALEWARLEIGASYDKLGVLALILDRVFALYHINSKPRKNRFSCAEFVAQAFSHSGARLFPDIADEDVIPADFARLLPQADTDSKRMPSATLRAG